MSKQKKPVKPISGLYRVVKFTLTYPVRFLCHMKVKGAENEPTPDQGTYLVIANHRTWADPIYLCCALKHQQPHFMAKKELFKIPLLNILIRALGAYPVNRGGADVSAIKHTIEMLKGGAAVGMFPQGHRYNGVDPRTTTVKTGAAMIAQKDDAKVGRKSLKKYPVRCSTPNPTSIRRWSRSTLKRTDFPLRTKKSSATSCVAPF